MAKRPPQKYEPGELERTRSNLGDVSEHEAKVLAQKLGGEVGVEKPDPEVTKGYERLKYINRRKGDRIINESPAGSQGFGEFAAHSDLSPSLTKIKQPKNLRYLEKMRINFLLADPDYRIKTTLNAYLSILSFAVPVKDTISSEFIHDFDSNFYKSIENLVLSVRGLMAINRNQNIRSVRHPAYIKILEILKSWDLDTMNHELTRLQSHPRGLRITETKRLTRAVYRPIIQLGLLDLHVHILKAVKHVSDLNFLGMPKNSPEIGRLKRLYTTAKQELLNVFTETKKGLYPLLLRLSKAHFYTFEDFFTYGHNSILEFLSLTENQLMSPFDDNLIMQELALKEEAEEKREKQALEDAASEEDEIPVKPVSVEKGLKFLDALFPEAGFLSLELYPDLYSYFQPILSFPGGLDLIHPGNPVHQVMVISAILQEMFYGFRSVKFGEIKREDGQYESVQPRIEGIISEWHKFTDEVLHQNYLSTLTDYCRQIERNPETKYADYGVKLEAMLQFFVRKYVFPHLHVYTLKGTKTPYSERLYRIYNAAAQTRELLEKVLNKDLTNAIPPSLKNSIAPFEFEIENHVSQRFRKYLKKRQQPENNRNLINYTLLVVSVLDYLCNDVDNFIYREKTIPHYRHEEGREEIPIYSIPPMDTQRILADSEIDLTPPDILLLKDESSRESMEESTKKIIKGHIDRLVNDNESLTVLAVSFISNELSRETDVYRIMESAIREYMDILLPEDYGSYLLILPETGENDALSLYDRLKEKLADYDEDGFLWACITPCMKSWGPSKLLKLARQGLSLAKEAVPPALFTYEPKEHDFQQIFED